MKSIKFTTHNDLCHGCGICVDTCPTNAIKIRIENGQSKPHLDKNRCVDCGRCLKACAGVGINISEIANEKFGNKGCRKHPYIGTYFFSYSGYSTDYETRWHGASGGLLTSFIAYLLDKHLISAAVVAENDLTQPFLNKVVLVHNSKELYKARSSKYCPVAFNGIIKQIKEESSKVIIVGLPCVIHGFRKYEVLDKRFGEKVFGYFGLYCSSGRTFNLTEYVFRQNGIDRKSLTYFQYRDKGCLGALVAKDKNGITEIPYQLYYHPLRSFFIPNRCQYCIDHYAELADVSFGDIHYGEYKKDKIGVNSVIIRNGTFDVLLKAAVDSGYIYIKELTEEELVKCQASAPKKKGRVAGVMKFAHVMGKPIPKYDVTHERIYIWESIAYYLFAKIQMFVGKRRLLWWIIPIFAKKGKVD